MMSLFDSDDQMRILLFSIGIVFMLIITILAAVALFSFLRLSANAYMVYDFFNMERWRINTKHFHRYVFVELPLQTSLTRQCTEI